MKSILSSCRYEIFELSTKSLGRSSQGQKSSLALGLRDLCLILQCFLIISCLLELGFTLYYQLLETLQRRR